MTSPAITLLRGIILFSISNGVVQHIVLCFDNEADNSLSLYLQTQLVIAKQDMTKDYNTQHVRKRETNFLNVTWNHLWNEAIESTNSATTLQLLKNIYIVAGESLQHLVDYEGSFRLVNITKLQGLSMNKSFVKVVEWNKIIFLVVATESGVVFLYTSSPSMDFQLAQTLLHSCRPVDAEFFIQNGELFLFIVFNKENNEPVSTGLYQWRFTYFDLVTNYVVTTGATSVTVFSYGSSVYMVVGQISGVKSQIGSQVLRKNANDTVVERVQYLPTRKPIAIEHFIFDHNYLVVIEETQQSKIFWWEGEEFVPWSYLPTQPRAVGLSIGYVRSSPIIVVSYENQVKMYSMTWAGPELLVIMWYDGKVVTSMFYEANRTLLISIIQTGANLETSIEEIFLKNMDKGMIGVDQSLCVDCLKQLELEVGFFKDHLFETQEYLPKIPAMDYNQTIRLPGRTKDVSDFKTAHVYSTMNVSVDNLMERLVNLQMDVSSSITLGFNKFSSIVLLADLFIGQATINKVESRTVNNILFEPKKFISLSNIQFIDNEVSLNSAAIDWLLVDELYESNIEDLKLPETYQIYSQSKVSSLKCRNLNLQSLPLINNVNTSSFIKLESQNSVTGLKKVISISSQNLVVQKLKHVPFMNQITRFVPLENIVQTNSFQLELKNNVMISELNVHELNRWPVKLQTQSAEVKIVPGRRSVVNELQNISNMKPITYYTGKVQIQGNLHVNELSISNSTLFLGTLLVPHLKVQDLLWTKNTSQEIWVPVTLSNGASVNGSVTTTEINRFSLLTSLNWHMFVRSSMEIYYKNVSIKGNIFSNQSISPSYNSLSLSQLSNQIIRRKGDHDINGQLVVLDGFNVINAHLTMINEQNSSHFSKKILVDSEGFNGIKSIEILGDITVKDDINITHVNGLQVADIFKSVVMADYKCLSLAMDLNKCSATHLNVKYVNGCDFENLSSDLSIQLSAVAQTMNLIVLGDVYIQELINTENINMFFVADIMKVLDGTQKNYIRGNKIFSSQVIMDNMNALVVDGVVTSQLHSHFLSRELAQTVNSFYTLQNISVAALNATKMNMILCDHFMHINETDVIKLVNDIQFEKLSMPSIEVPDLFGGCIMSTKGLTKRELEIHTPYHWNHLSVLQSTKWKSDVLERKQILGTLLKHSVRSASSNTVNGQVTFLHSVSIANLTSETTINDVKMSNIIDDSLKTRSPYQEIKGHMMFIRKVWAINAQANIGIIDSINTVNILALNSSLVQSYDESFVKGKKYFTEGFQSFIINSEGGLNNVIMEKVVLKSRNKLIPYTSFSKLTVVNELNFEFANTILMGEFLKKCIKLESTKPQAINGSITFKSNIYLNEEASMPSVNGLFLYDLVLKQNDSPKTSKQVISGCKRFITTVKSKGTVAVTFANELSLNTYFKGSVLEDQETWIQGNVMIDNIVYMMNIFGESYYNNGSYFSAALNLN